MPKTSKKIRNYLNIRINRWEYIDKLESIELNNIEPLFERK